MINNISAEVLDFLQSKTTIDMRKISADTNLMEAGIIDSLQLIELILWIESAIQKPVEIELLAPDNILTLQSISDYLISERT